MRNSFFSGTLKDHDADSLVGSICGLTALYGDNLFVRYYLGLENNACVKSSVYACGGLSTTSGTYQTIYSATALEENAGSTALLDMQTTVTESLDELKALEIYYDDESA